MFEYIGFIGKYYMVILLLRILYYFDLKYMFKFLFLVKVMNLMCINKLKEFESGFEGKEMLNMVIGEVWERFLGFDFICDLVFIILNYGI